MDMFDLFRESAQETNAPVNETPSDSPPIPESETPAYYAAEEPSTLPPALIETRENALVLCVPGSLIFRKDKFRLSWLHDLSSTIEQLRANNVHVALVVGESSDTRLAARTAHQLGVHASEIEQLNRASSGVHASLVLRTLAKAHPQVCEEIDETLRVLDSENMPVMLGSKGSHSTEARAAMLAEHMGAKLVILSDFQIPTHRFSHAQFSKMASQAFSQMDEPFIVDPLATLVLARSKIDTFLIWGKHLNQIASAIDQEEFEGTVISSSKSVPKKSVWKEK